MSARESRIEIEAEHEPSESWPLRRRELLAILAFWTFMAVLGSLNQLVDPRMGTGRWTAGEAVAREFIDAVLWGCLTPAIFWLSARVRVDRSQWVGPVLLLAGVGLLSAVFADVAEDVLEIRLLGAPADMPGTSPVESLLRLWFLNDLMIFVAVLAAGLARVYFLRYRSRQDQAARLRARAGLLEAQLAEARLEALRMQLNPHFLFNTLHAVSSLVDRDPDGVRRMIAKLAGLLRTTLRGDTGPDVPLSRELEFLEDYLEIMRIRFQGRLDVDFDIEPGLLGARVPHLILQPLVENAMEHGVGESEGRSRVLLKARSDGDQLVLSVLDSGPGLRDDRAISSEEGIGLRNVRERLERLYDRRASLTLENRAEAGARAEIRLPLRIEGPDATPHSAPGRESGARPATPAEVR